MPVLVCNFCTCVLSQVFLKGDQPAIPFFSLPLQGSGSIMSCCYVDKMTFWKPPASFGPCCWCAIVDPWSRCPAVCFYNFAPKMAVRTSHKEQNWIGSILMCSHGSSVKKWPMDNSVVCLMTITSEATWPGHSSTFPSAVRSGDWSPASGCVCRVVLQLH